MKNKQIMGSKKFWMILAVILGVFIVVTGVFLAWFSIRIQTTSVIPAEQTTQATGQQTLDHSFEATKERVDSVNDNYGQNVKSSYYGNYSTMERMMQSRIFFSNLKGILMIILVVMVILLILTKGFNIRLFKRTLVEGEIPDKTKPAEKSAQKPQTVIPIPEAECSGEQQIIEQTESEPPEEAVPKMQEEDEQEIADSCQLP